MKTKLDYNTQLEMILLGLSFLILYFISDSLRSSSAGILWLFISITPILLGLWKMEQYEVNGTVIKKPTFLGLFTSKYDFTKLNEFKIKSVDMSRFSSPHIFLYLYAKPKRYSRFRIVILEFDNNRKMRINENFIKGNQLNILLKEIKKHQKKIR